MSTRWESWVQTLGVGTGIWLLLQAQISGWWQRPKVEGEAKQAAGSGIKSEAEAEAVDAEARIKEWGEHLRRADEALKTAAEAHNLCRTCLLKALDALESTIDAIERVT